MGALTRIDPKTVRPLAGKGLVRIVEILGGTSDGGIYIPGSLQDHSGKDTFYGEMVRLGPPPSLTHYKTGPGPGWDVKKNSTGKVWPPEVMAQFKEGDIFVFPRDVEVVFVWEEQRYCIVLIHEAIIGIDRKEFDSAKFEVKAWKPPEIPGVDVDDEDKSIDELLDEVESELLDNDYDYDGFDLG